MYVQITNCTFEIGEVPDETPECIHTGVCNWNCDRKRAFQPRGSYKKPMGILAEPSSVGTLDTYHYVLDRNSLHARIRLDSERCVLLGTNCIPCRLDFRHPGSICVLAGLEVQYHWCPLWKFPRTSELATQMGVADAAFDRHDTWCFFLSRMGHCGLRFV